MINFRVPIVIVGNKVDLQHASRMVTKEDGSKLAQKWRAAFIETSAKDNTVRFLLAVIYACYTIFTPAKAKTTFRVFMVEFNGWEEITA